MQTKRYDIYTAFHKLLRSRLFEASVRLGRADFSMEAQAGEDAGTIAFLRETLDLLVDHAAKEDAYVQRLLHGYGGRLGAELDAEHAAIEDAMAAIDRLAVDLVRLEGPARARQGEELYARFNRLVADQVRHMAREESEANAVLWAHLSDRELAELHQTIIHTASPERTAWLLEQLLPVWCLAERAGMWRHTRGNAPAPVIEMVRRIGAQVLGPVGWAQVERAAGA